MSSDSVVDLGQLDLISDGNAESRQLYIESYLTATELDLSRLKIAIESGDTSTVLRVAHACLDTSLSYGMTAVVPAFRRLEAKAKGGSLIGADDDLLEAGQQFVCIQAFLKDFPPTISEKPAHEHAA